MIVYLQKILKIEDDDETLFDFCMRTLEDREISLVKKGKIVWLALRDGDETIHMWPGGVIKVIKPKFKKLEEDE